MNNDHREILNLRRLPGSIDAEQTAILFGIPVTCITILVNKGFIKPLGKTVAHNAPRRFASAAVIELTQDAEQMHKMQHLISSHWRVRNRTQGRRGNCCDNAMRERLPAAVSRTRRRATLKAECFAGERPAARQAAKLQVFDRIEGCCNRTRLLSGLGYQSPPAFEQNLSSSRN